jgi:hypothetical protein
MTETFGELDHPPRLLMGPGPINVHPRVLRAMSVQLLGQFDPEFTAYMNQTMALYRQVFCTQNRWTFLIDGTSRAAIEAALVSTLSPGDGDRRALRRADHLCRGSMGDGDRPPGGGGCGQARAPAPGRRRLWRHLHHHGPAH